MGLNVGTMNKGARELKEKKRRVPDEIAIRIFRTMLTIRRFEETVIELWASENVEGPRHVYIGQEAVAAVVCEIMIDEDTIVSTHRNHGHVVARGGDLGKALAEILGRVDGYNLGRAGSPGITARDKGFLFTTGQIGGGIGLSTGAALAHKVANQGGISVAFFGDGSLEEGVSFEAMNIAALFELPVLYVCENNSVGVTTGRAQNEWSFSLLSADTLGDIPRSLRITTEIVAGEDVESLYNAVSKLMSGVRQGNTAPAFIETRSHRWPGSRSFDPSLVAGVTDLSWITEPFSVQGEHADWINDFDPIVRFGRDLIEGKVLDGEALVGMDEEVAARISAAREFALASSEPTAELTLGEVYA